MVQISRELSRILSRRRALSPESMLVQISRELSRIPFRRRALSPESMLVQISRELSRILSRRRALSSESMLAQFFRLLLLSRSPCRAFSSELLLARSTRFLRAFLFALSSLLKRHGLVLSSHRLIPTRQAAPFHLELFRPSAWIHDGRRSDAFSTRQSLIPRYSHVRSAGRSVFHVAEIRRYDGCSLPPTDELSLGHLVAVALIIMLEDVQQQSPKRRSVCNKNQPPPTSGMSLRGRTAESADRLSSNNSIYYLTTSMFTFSIKIQGLGGIYRLSSLDRLMENIVRGSSVAVDVEEDNKNQLPPTSGMLVCCDVGPRRVR